MGTEEEKTDVEEKVDEALEENFENCEKKAVTNGVHANGEAADKSEGAEDAEMAEERTKRKKNLKRMKRPRLSQKREIPIVLALLRKLRTRRRTRINPLRMLRTKRTPATCSSPGRCLSWLRLCTQSRQRPPGPQRPRPTWRRSCAKLTWFWER